MHEIIIFGGELWNGDAVTVFDELYRYRPESNSWMRVTEGSSGSPQPRSGHQAVTHANSMWLFGGEFASPQQSRFKHFRDTWCLDLVSNEWEQIEPAKARTLQK